MRTEELTKAEKRQLFMYKIASIATIIVLSVIIRLN